MTNKNSGRFILRKVFIEKVYEVLVKCRFRDISKLKGIEYHGKHEKLNKVNILRNFRVKKSPRLEKVR